jgi:hypothetical protein
MRGADCDTNYTTVCTLFPNNTDINNSHTDFAIIVNLICQVGETRTGWPPCLALCDVQRCSRRLGETVSGLRNRMVERESDYGQPNASKTLKIMDEEES